METILVKELVIYKDGRLDGTVLRATVNVTESSFYNITKQEKIYISDYFAITEMMVTFHKLVGFNDISIEWDSIKFN